MSPFSGQWLVDGPRMNIFVYIYIYTELFFSAGEGLQPVLFLSAACMLIGTAKLVSVVVILHIRAATSTGFGIGSNRLQVHLTKITY